MLLQLALVPLRLLLQALRHERLQCQQPPTSGPGPVGAHS